MTLEIRKPAASDPVFKGLCALLDVIHGLIDRPRWLRKESEIRGDRTLPILCLIREARNKAFLGALSNRLAAASPDRVPHVSVDAERAAAEARKRSEKVGRVPPVLPLLDEILYQFVADRFGRGGLNRFRHYRLADWLTAQTTEPADGHAGRSPVTKLLRQWYRRDRGGWTSSRFVAFLLVRPWSRGVPLFGRETRWLLKQPFMVPLHSLTFPGFAERLTIGRRDMEQPDQVKKLLVHAFLQDLRVAYAPRRLWLRRWRRTAYPVALLDHITEDNGGWELLRLVNDVRNERGDLDPLLVIAGSEQLATGLSEPSTEVVPVHKIKTALDDWERRLPERRQRMTGDARFLAVYLSDEEPSDADEAAWPETRTFRPRKPPWLAMRGRLVALILVIALLPLVVATRWTTVRLAAGCLPDPSSGVSALWDEELGECLGHSDDTDLVFGDDERLTHVQRAVFEQNALAEEYHEAGPERPLVSVVYFAALTHADSSPGTDQSVADELEGLLMRQLLQNQPDTTGPVLRVIVANGGTGMKGALRVVRETLTPLLADDPTVLGVIGMDRTVPETERAIEVLGELGVPVVATTLTGEGLPDRSPMYFQLVPGNHVQARLVTEYARMVDRHVTVYHPPLDDGYTRTLVDELRKALGPHGTVRGWRISVNEAQIRCGQDEIAYFAGRETQFAEFLIRVVESCMDNVPMVIGDDTIIRFVAQLDDRDHPELNRLPVSWVDMGGLVVLAGKSCRLDGVPATSARWHPLKTFCALYQRVHHSGDPLPPAADEYADVLDRSAGVPWAGQGVGLAYDAAGLFLSAVKENRRRLGHPGMSQRGAIAQEFREGADFRGATSLISFRDRRDGAQRNLAILTISDISDINDINDIASVPACRHIVGDTTTRSAGSCPG